MNSINIPERTVTLHSWFHSYAYKLRARSNRSGYIDVRLNALEHNIIYQYPDTLVKDLSAEQLLKCFQSMAGLKWSYIGQVISWADAMFEDCVSCGEREDNPLRRLKFMPVLIGGEH